METTVTMSSNMVAAGTKVLGAAAQSATQTVERKVPAMPQWMPRTGRTSAFVLWEDALRDVLPTMGMRRDDVYEEPPPRPNANTLSRESLDLWSRAMEEYQATGTMLFEIVRPSLDLDGPWAGQDIRLIQGWKRDGVKDGRSLVRWALSFTDRSSIAGQMRLVKQINAATLSAAATVFDLSEHLANLWELWLALGTSSRDAPASFFRQLIISLPTAPEGPLVKMRSWLVDLVEDGLSPLLHDIDSEQGLLARMVKYATSHGLEDKPVPSLSAMQSGAPPGGEYRDKDKDKDRDKDKDKDKEKKKCNECRAFACKKPGGKCICKWDSTFDLSAITNTGKRQYVELMRAYNKMHPTKSLANVSVKVVREEVDKGKGDSNKRTGNMAYLTSVSAVLGDEVSSVSELDAWLTAHDSEPGGFYVLGDTSGEGVLKFEVVEDETLATEPATDAVLNAMSSSSKSSTCSSLSARTAGEVTETELEMAKLKTELATRQQALENSQARVLVLEQETASFKLTPSIAAAPIETQRPNPQRLIRRQSCHHGRST